MTRVEHLLFILAEECAEVAQRASKAARFGLGDIEPGQDMTAAERVNGELLDLYAVAGILVREGSLDSLMDIIVRPDVARAIEAKQQKVERFLAYSRECGTLS